MKRLSSNYTKYVILAFVFLPLAGLLVTFAILVFQSNSIDWNETGNNLVPVIGIALFLSLTGLFSLSIFNEVYYDKEYIYLKKIYQKQFEKFDLNTIDSIDHSPLMGPDIIVINGEKYFFAVSLLMYFKRDILGHIRK